MSLLQELTPNPLTASNISVSAVFRAIDECRPTLILDEADTFLAKHGELRGIINSGHSRQAAFVVRVVGIGKKQTPVKFSTWAPKAIASIGMLSDTLQDRSIAIRLRRKLPSEKVQKFRADHVQYLTNLCRMAVRWAADNMDKLRKLDTPVPTQLHDRQADNWRALFNIAKLIGGDWLTKAREAALAIEGAARKCQTLGEQLLADCRTVFEDRHATELSAEEIIAEICNLDENTWANYRGKRITSDSFAAILRDFEIYSKRKTSGQGKGRMKWYRTDFEDAWQRYL